MINRVDYVIISSKFRFSETTLFLPRPVRVSSHLAPHPTPRGQNRPPFRRRYFQMHFLE